MVVFLVPVVGEIGGPLDGSQWLVLAPFVTVMLCHAGLVAVVTLRALVNRPRLEVAAELIRISEERGAR